MTSRSAALSVWAERIARHLVSDRPALIIVENCRAKIDTSFGLTPVTELNLVERGKAALLCRARG